MQKLIRQTQERLEAISSALEGEKNAQQNCYEDLSDEQQTGAKGEALQEALAQLEDLLGHLEAAIVSCEDILT